MNLSLASITRLPSLIGLGRKSAVQSPDGTLEIFRELMGGRRSRTGDTVTWETALKVSTVMACARVIGKGLAQVPCKIYREQGKTRLPARDHPLYALLNRRTNLWQTGYGYMETIGLHLTVYENHYSYITRGVGGRILELLPLPPNRVRPEVLPDLSMVYHVTGMDGTTKTIPSSSIWHVRGLSWSGAVGLDVLNYARDVIGLALATEGSHADLHRNGLQPSGLYTVDRELDEEGFKKLRKWIVAQFKGMLQGLPMVLDKGATYSQLAMKGVDAQHLETRRFQIEETCRALGVMPIMVFSNDKATTYASAEAMYQAHLVHTMAGEYRRLELAIDADLITNRDYTDGYYAKFVVQALMHASLKDKGEYLARALGSGGAPAWMTQDEARGFDELNPMGGTAAQLPVATNVSTQGAPAGAPSPAPSGA